MDELQIPGSGAYRFQNVNVEVGRVPGVVRVSDGASIPEAEDNQDWVVYQAWLAAGNTPLPAPSPPPLTEISTIDFFHRFTLPEQVAIQTAINTTPTLGVGLVNGLAAGSIDLAGDAVKAWMDGLVAAGAITQEREKKILTP